MLLCLDPLSTTHLILEIQCVPMNRNAHIDEAKYSMDLEPNTMHSIFNTLNLVGYIGYIISIFTQIFKLR